MKTEMPEIQPIDEIAKVRVEDTVPTDKPGLAATKPDPGAAAKQRRQILSQIPPGIWSLLSPEKRPRRRRR
jgi:hypothetical protein